MDNGAARELADRWAFMHPWCAPLCGRLALPQTHRDDTTMVSWQGFNVDLFADGTATTVATLLDIRKGLQLLATAATTDVVVWKHVLAAHCGLQLGSIDVPTLDHALSFEQPLFVIKLTEDNDEADWSWMVEMLSIFFNAAMPPRHESELFVAISQVQTRAIKGRQPSQEHLDIPISIVIDSLTRGTLLDTTWRALKALERKHQGWRFPVPSTAGGKRRSCAFVLSSASLEQFLGGEQCLESARLYEEILDTCNGLKISNVVFTSGISREFVNDDATSARAAGRLYERVLCPSSCSYHTACSVDKVDILCSPQHADDFYRFCSAVAATTTVRDLTLRLDPFDVFEEDNRQEDQARHWQWLAYALFSKHAREHSSVVSVSLEEITMTIQDVHAMAAVLTAQDPIKQLHGCSPVTTASEPDRVDGSDEVQLVRDIGILKQGTSITLVPMHPDSRLSDGDAAWELPKDVDSVVLLQNENTGEFDRVLVPGYGVCKTERGNFIKSEARKCGGGGVTSLAVHSFSSHESPQALRSFIKLVGAPLTRLVLTLPVNGSSMVPRILKYCPKLKTLVLKSRVVDTQELLQANRKYSLSLEELDCHFDNNCAIMKELADKRTRLAQSLKRLAYVADADNQPGHGDHDDDDDDEDTSEDGCTLNMLSANSTLEHLTVAIPQRLYYPSRREGFQDYDNELLPVAREPLPLECRLAFISIFSSSGRSTAARNGEDDRKRARVSTLQTTVSPSLSVLAECPIDRLVFSLIFEFAAPCVRRRIHFQLRR